MSNRVFQSVILQMRDATDRTVGVANPDGTVVAATDLSLIGSDIGELPENPRKSVDTTITKNGRTYKTPKQGSANKCIIFVEGEDELAKSLCMMASIVISETADTGEDNTDKMTFIKTIISGNILPGDVAVSAKKLRFTPDAIRGVLVVRLNNASNLTAIDLVQNTFPDKQNDYVFTIGDTDIVIVKEMPYGSDTEYLISLARMIHKKIESGLSQASFIGVATPATDLRELAERYKQALIAIDIGRVFETGEAIISYANLGISRLIYQLPITLCEIFLSEVFKQNPIEVLDQETLFTIDKFFENSLNVSETARKLYIHRNTLVYRLEKINKITGLDLREFDHAIVFKVALMVKKYLTSQEQK